MIGLRRRIQRRTGWLIVKPVRVRIERHWDGFQRQHTLRVWVRWPAYRPPVK